MDFSGQIRIRGFHSLKSRIRKTALKARNHKKDSEDFFLKDLLAHKIYLIFHNKIQILFKNYYPTPVRLWATDTLTKDCKEKLVFHKTPPFKRYKL